MLDTLFFAVVASVALKDNAVYRGTSGSILAGSKNFPEKKIPCMSLCSYVCQSAVLLHLGVSAFTS